MTKKAIKYPPVLNINLNGQISTYGLNDFCLYLVDTCRIFNETGVGIRAGARIDAAVRSVIELESTGLPQSKVSELILEAEDLDKLDSVCEEPDKGYPFLPARALLPFIDAIKEAAETEKQETEDKA
jgi:hypothetical protein